MKVFWSLLGLYLRGFYNLSGKKAPGEKKSLKDGLKGIGIAVLAAVLVLDIGVIFVFINLGLYDALAPAELQGLVILNVAILATALTLIVGFLTALSTYFMSDMELFLLSMPIRPRALFGAKFGAIYASEAALSLFFMATTMVIFGIRESPPFMFYVWGTLSAFLLPFVPLAVSYLVLIPLLKALRFLRNKQVMFIISGLMAMALGVGFNIYYQGMMSHLSDPAWIAENLGGPNSLIVRLGQAYPPAMFMVKAMTEPVSLSALASMLAMAALCLACPALLIALCSGAYARSLIGFNESRVRKLNKGEAQRFLDTRIKSGHAMLSLIRREFNAMNREPVYFLNGPMIIILMPLIMGVMLFAQKDAFMNDPDFAPILALLAKGGGVAIAGLAGAFLGSSTSITCTALSRDAKALHYIKSLPISASRYMYAKLAHGLLFALVGSLVGPIFLGLAIKLSFAQIAIAILIALSLSALLNLLGLWLDTANPRLSWDNPVAAMKQNPNSVIAVLASMGLSGLLGLLVFKTGMGDAQILLWLGLLPALAFGLLLIPYPRFAEKKLASIEA